MAQTVLVTGAAGFIGGNVCRAALDRGWRVVGIDNFDPFYPRAVKQAQLDAVHAHACAAPREGAARGTFSFHEADCTDRAAIDRVFEREQPTGIIHLAGKAGVRPSLRDPAGYMLANVLGTQVVLSAATDSPHRSVRRCVIASSSSVYGNDTPAPFREDADVSKPISPYAASKRAAELLAFTHHLHTRLPIACLRFFTVFGPGQRPDLAIAQFLAKVDRGEPIQMFGDGRTARDYTYVDDIVAGVFAAFDRVDQFGYRVWNLGHNEPVTLSAMIAAVGRAVGKEPKITPAPMQPGDVELTCASIDRAAAELGYHPRVSLHEGLRRQWAAASVLAGGAR